MAFPRFLFDPGYMGLYMAQVCVLRSACEYSQGRVGGTQVAGHVREDWGRDVREDFLGSPLLSLVLLLLLRVLVGVPQLLLLLLLGKGERFLEARPRAWAGGGMRTSPCPAAPQASQLQV